MAADKSMSKLGIVQLRGGARVDLDRLRDDIQAGKHPREIAQQIGLRESTVRQLCKDNGIPRAVWKSAPMSSEECFYVAACIDCEGMLTAHVPWNKRRNSRNVAIYARVQMTCPLVPARLQTICGGIFRGPLPPRKPTESPTFYWNLPPNGCRYVLPQILPHLLTKKRQAEILLEILDNNRHGHFMPMERLLPLLKELRSLNKRGPAPDRAPTHWHEVRELTTRVVSDEQITCACGCGALFSRFDRRGRERRFIHGHNGHPERPTLAS